MALHEGSPPAHLPLALCPYNLLSLPAPPSTLAPNPSNKQQSGVGGCPGSPSMGAPVPILFQSSHGYPGPPLAARTSGDVGEERRRRKGRKGATEGDLEAAGMLSGLSPVPTALYCLSPCVLGARLGSRACV